MAGIVYLFLLSYLYFMIVTMRTRRKGILLMLSLASALNLFAQEPDTASLGYQVGYHIGSWLPFSIIALLAVLIILKSSRQGRDS